MILPGFVLAVHRQILNLCRFAVGDSLFLFLLVEEPEEGFGDAKARA